MDPERFNISDLLPHQAPMMLLHQLTQVDETTATCRAIVQRDCIFLDNRGALPAALGIEWMAQAVAVHAGYLALSSGSPIALGYLLGTRKYRCARSTLDVGEQFDIHVEELFKGNGMASFQCTVSQDSEVIIEATINTYQPEVTGATAQGDSSV